MRRALSAMVRGILPLLAAGAMLSAAPVLAAHAQSGSAGGSFAMVALPGGLNLSLSSPPVLPPVEVTPSASGQVSYLPLPSFQVADATGTGRGWRIRFQATPFQSENGNALPSGSLLMAAPAIACASGTSCSGRAAPPALAAPFPAAVDGDVPLTVASAAPNTGMGTYTFIPGSFDGNPSHNLALTVLPSAPPGTYTSILTVSVVSGP